MAFYNSRVFQCGSKETKRRVFDRSGPGHLQPGQPSAAVYANTLANDCEGGTDYPYRATISHADFGAGLAGQGIRYSNFKSEVAKVMGWQRSDLLQSVGCNV